MIQSKPHNNNSYEIYNVLFLFLMLPTVLIKKTGPQAPKGSAITSILQPKHWLSSDEIDFVSHLAREYNEIDGFQSSLLFGVLQRGGIVGTPTRPFVQTLHTGKSLGDSKQPLCW